MMPIDRFTGNVAQGRATERHSVEQQCTDSLPAVRVDCEGTETGIAKHFREQSHATI
jgi:hypothetical protein